MCLFILLITFLNYASFSQCIFLAKDTNISSISAFLSAAKPTFIDIDNDGDKDCPLACIYGTMFDTLRPLSFVYNLYSIFL